MGKEYCSSSQSGGVFWNTIDCLHITHSSRMMNKELKFGRCWNKYVLVYGDMGSTQIQSNLDSNNSDANTKKEQI